MRGVTILGNDDDGFIRMHIDLAALRTTNSTDAPNKDTGKQPPAQGNSCSTPPGVASRFDTIEVKDISNMGFRLVLDDIRLISSASFSVADSPLLPLSNMVPVLADDLDELKSGNNRYLLKLKRNTTPDQLKDVCRELSSGADNRRFTGMCHSNLATVRSGAWCCCSDLSAAAATDAAYMHGVAHSAQHAQRQSNTQHHCQHTPLSAALTVRNVTACFLFLPAAKQGWPTQLHCQDQG